MSMRDDMERILITQEEIDSAVRTLARMINETYKDKHLLFVGLLKGSLPFMADLIKYITIPCKIDFMCVSSYGGGTKSSGRVNILKDLSQPIAGEDVIIVEDIIDSGHTLDFIINYLSAKNANSVKICTLLDKPARRECDIKVDYSCFEIPDEFVVGYGLDFDEYYRNLPYIGILKSEVYEN